MKKNRDFFRLRCNLYVSGNFRSLVPVPLLFQIGNFDVSAVFNQSSMQGVQQYNDYRCWHAMYSRISTRRLSRFVLLAKQRLVESPGALFVKTTLAGHQRSKTFSSELSGELPSLSLPEIFASLSAGLRRAGSASGALFPPDAPGVFAPPGERGS